MDAQDDPGRQPVGQPEGRRRARLGAAALDDDSPAPDGIAVRRGRVVVQRSGPEPGASSGLSLSDRLPAGVVLGVHRATAPLAWHRAC